MNVESLNANRGYQFLIFQSYPLALDHMSLFENSLFEVNGFNLMCSHAHF